MKLLLSILVLATLAQAHDVSNERFLISEIVQNAMQRLEDLLNTALKDLYGSLVSILASVDTLVENVIYTISDLVTNSLDLIGDLLEDARNAGKQIEACSSRLVELENVNNQTAIELESCKTALDVSVEQISSELKEAESRGRALIAGAIPAFQSCRKQSNFFACLSKEVTGATQEIQGIVASLEQPYRTAVTASVNAASCVNDAERNARDTADRIYKEIIQCITNAQLVD